MAVKWKWKPAAGGSVSPELQNKVNQLETKTNTIESKYVKKDEANTFTAANTFNGQVAINSGAQDFTWNSTRTWAENMDNTVVKTADMKWLRVIEKIGNIAYPSNSWNTSAWNWPLANITANDGVYEILMTLSYQDNVAESFRAEIVWKSGLNESRSQVVSIEKNGRLYSFQFVIKSDNKLYVYTKHDNQGSQANISWIRGWIKRGITLPAKMDPVW